MEEGKMNVTAITPTERDRQTERERAKN